MLETLLQIRHKIRHVVVPRNNGGGLADPSLKLALENSGFTGVCEIDELGLVETADGSITSIPFLGEHGDLNIRSKTTYLVRALGRSFLFCADSNAFEPRLYDHLADVVGDLDVAFVGMECDGAPMSWLYGPLVTAPLARRMDQSRRLDASDCERGMELVKRLRPAGGVRLRHGLGALADVPDLDPLHRTVPTHRGVARARPRVPGPRHLRRDALRKEGAAARMTPTPPIAMHGPASHPRRSGSWPRGTTPGPSIRETRRSRRSSSRSPDGSRTRSRSCRRTGNRR